MKYRATKISPAKMNNSAGKALVKSPRLKNLVYPKSTANNGSSTKSSLQWNTAHPDLKKKKKSPASAAARGATIDLGRPVTALLDLIRSAPLCESQQKAREVCQVYFMKLRSGKEKKAYYFRKETTKRSSPKTAGNYKEPHLVFTDYKKHREDLERSAEAFASDIPMVQNRIGTINESSIQERSFSLSTYNNQSITFADVDGGYEIYVADERKEQKKDKVLFRFYDLQPSGSETGDSVDGQKSMVSLSPTKDKAVLLHANNEEDSVELQKCENLLPDRTFFFLHTEPGPSTCVSFECKSNPGVYIGVKDNHLALIKLKDQTEHSRENIKFKVS